MIPVTLSDIIIVVILPPSLLFCICHPSVFPKRPPTFQYFLCDHCILLFPFNLFPYSSIFPLTLFKELFLFHFLDQITWILLFLPLLFPNAPILAMILFYFTGLYSCHRLCTHILLFGAKSPIMNKNMWKAFVFLDFGLPWPLTCWWILSLSSLLDLVFHFNFYFSFFLY